MMPKPVRKLEGAGRSVDDDLLFSEFMAFERKSCVFAFTDLTMTYAVSSWLSKHTADDVAQHAVCSLPPSLFLVFPCLRAERSVELAKGRASASMAIERVTGVELLRSCAFNHTSVCLIDAARTVETPHVVACGGTGRKGVLLRGTFVGLGASSRRRYMAGGSALRAHMDRVFSGDADLERTDYRVVHDQRDASADGSSAA